MIIANYGYQMYLDEEYLGAKIFCETMIMLSPHDSYFHNLLGACHEKLNNRDQAYNAYKEALRLNPQFTQARNNIERLEGN